jgi:hypothetical protein
MPLGDDGRGGGRWVTTMQIWHWRAKRYVKRRDGKPFRFRIS